MTSMLSLVEKAIKAGKQVIIAHCYMHIEGVIFHERGAPVLRAICVFDSIHIISRLSF